MKLASRKQKILAILMGLVMLAVLCVQMYRDGYRLIPKNIGKIQNVKTL